MLQSRELAIKYGFKFGQDVHFVWWLHQRLKDLEKDINYHQKKQQEYKRQGKHTLVHDREITIGQSHRAYLEIEGILTMMFNSNYYYCCRCGALSPTEITCDKKCALCGGSLPI